jgi:phosphatidylinositol glycan class B
MSGITRPTLVRVLIALTVLGALARLLAWRCSPIIHPDEIYQALEPGWWHLEGTGLPTWEWREGIRSWVLPAYNGAWMAALQGLGVKQGATLGWFIQLHWALVSLLLLPMAYRGGALVMQRLHPVSPRGGQEAAQAGWQGGLLAMASCALFPLVVAYAPHTLTELPSMLCLVAALVFTAELVWRDEQGRGKALAIGALLALGLCIRVVNAPLVVLPPLWLLAHRRWPALGWVALGALGPVLLFGLCDLLTWGRFAGSYVSYIQFNFLRGGAAQFGVEAWHWYLRRLLERAPLGLGLILVPLLLGLRGSWPFAVSAMGLLGLLSLETHKEERFMLAFWPLVLIGAGGVLGAWLLRLGRLGRGRRAALAALVLAAAAPLVDGLFHLEPKDLSFSNAWLEGQARAGADPSATGLMVESILFTGGSLFYGRRLALFHVEDQFLDNAMVSHVLVRAGSDHERSSLRAGFVPVWRRDDAILLRRP